MAASAILNFGTHVLLMNLLRFMLDLLSVAFMLKAIFKANRWSPKPGRNFDVFGAGDPLEINLSAPNQKRHVYETEHVIRAIERANRSRITTCRRDGETEKKKKKAEQKSQNRYISPLCGGAPFEPISTKFDVSVGLINIITYAKNDSRIVIGFPGRQVEKRMFPNREPTAYITLPCATALACDLSTEVKFAELRP